MDVDERTPQERIKAFADAVDEEIVTPVRRYLHGFRRGVVLGLIVGVLFAPGPGREIRERGLRAWRSVSRHLPGVGERS
jgi:hypothetical protein